MLKIRKELEARLRGRVRKFQSLLREAGIDAAMIRTLSTFRYFTGVKWLRPSLLIPAEGDPVAFVARGEEEGFKELTWVDEVVPFTDGGDLMGKVSGLIRRNNYGVVGIEFGVERDAFILFYEMFKSLNPKVRVVDALPITSGMRLIKDEFEVEAVREASRIAKGVVEEVLASVRLGLREVDIASKAYALLFSAGCESPLVYVNAGPHPRIHAEPLRNSFVEEGKFLTLVIGADHDGYYANVARTVAVDNAGGEALKALECMRRVHDLAEELSVAGKRFIDVMGELDKAYGECGFLKYRVLGYAHGVGLQIEETPITTIIPKHRFMRIEEGMVLASVHSPLMIEGLGQVKFEDTYLVEGGGVRCLTC